MINFDHIGKKIAEDLLKEVNPQVGPCFYPGKFKPPHKGHFEAAKFLSAYPNVNKVYVIISNVTKFGITAQDSLFIWQEYLLAEHNPKIEVKISSESNPIKDIFTFIKNNPEIEPVYVAAAKEEAEEHGYFYNLEQRYPNKVKSIIVPDQYERISATQMRNAIKIGDFDGFAKFMPDASFNKGVTKDAFNKLLKIIK